jgi:hypothetical protein
LAALARISGNTGLGPFSSSVLGSISKTGLRPILVKRVGDSEWLAASVVCRGSTARHLTAISHDCTIWPTALSAAIALVDGPLLLLHHDTSRATESRSEGGWMASLSVACTAASSASSAASWDAAVDKQAQRHRPIATVVDHCEGSAWRNKALCTETLHARDDLSRRIRDMRGRPRPARVEACVLPDHWQVSSDVDRPFSSPFAQPPNHRLSFFSRLPAHPGSHIFVGQ